MTLNRRGYAFNTLCAEGFDAFIFIDTESLVSDHFLQEFASWLADGVDAMQCCPQR